jgi:hypothetical protein
MRPLRRIRNSQVIEELDGSIPSFLAATAAVMPNGLGDLLAYREGRIQAPRGLLEHDADAISA